MRERRSVRNLELVRAAGRFEAYSCRRAMDRLCANMTFELAEALEGERGRIARELHDTASQSLVGMLLNLELIERRLPAASPEVKDRLARSKQLATLTLDQLRHISHQLHPPEWKDLDFPAAVEWLVASMGLRDQFAVEIGDTGAPQSLHPSLRTILYRALQEALTNVLKHSAARRVIIRAPLTADAVGLVVEDDGEGFDSTTLEPARGGIGLANIRHRVESVGGSFQLESAPGHGTRLSVVVPAQRTNP